MNCSLCAELDEQEGRFYPDRFPTARHRSRVFERDDRLALLPTLGPLTDAHVIVVPVEHVLSLGAAGSAILEDAARVVERFEALVGRVLIFEHGSAGRGERAGACIDHAHVHLLTLPEGVPIPPPPAEFEWNPLPRLAELGDVVCASPSYMLFGTADKLVWAAAPEATPSQFLRRHVHRALRGAGSWDWRIDPRIEMLDAIVDRLSDAHLLPGEHA
jgi:diadenosine tetraphosphate (Ap4A) HIT family hydrolase